MLKTNMMMSVRLGSFGKIDIGHKTKLGNALEILEIGNQIREEKGLGKKTLHTYLRSKDTWEKIIKIYNEEVAKKDFRHLPKNSNEVNSDEKDFSQLAKNFYPLSFVTLEDLPKGKRNQIDYPELMKAGSIFSTVAKVQNRGAFQNRGTWLNLYLLLDLAEWLDIDLWYEVKKTFVEGKILEYRDNGGEAFKALNNAIDTLPDRLEKAKKRNISIVKNNKHVYRHISDEVQKALGTYDNGSHGYNEEEHSSEVQKNRATLLDFLTNGIRFKMITSYPQLKEVIQNFTF